MFLSQLYDSVFLRYKRYERRFSDDIDKVWASGGKSIEYTLNAWDFAGQEDFYSTHQCYLSNRAIYLVGVYSV